MSIVGLILLVFAFVCECFAAFNWPSPDHRGRIIAAGLAFFFLSLLLGDITKGLGVH